jgi:hypothetical protein
MEMRALGCLSALTVRSALFALCIPLIAAVTRAQPPLLWAETFGGSNIDIGHSVVQTADSGFAVTGYTRSFGTTSGRNVWLLKTDAQGEEEWNRAFGGNDDDEGHCVAQTSDGGFIIAGHTSSFGAGGKDVLLIKCDSLGQEEWTVTFGGVHDDEGYAVLEVLEGGYLIAGTTSSYGAGGRDLWLVRTDELGGELWSRTHGGYGSDGAWSVRQTADGGFIASGWTFSHGPGYLGNAWLLKTDPSGFHEWNSWFGGSDADRAYDVRQTSDGGYILAGYTGSYGAGLYDMLLLKTDHQGDQEWMKTFGGTGRDYGHSVVQTENGGYAAVGYTLSYGAGSDDLWLVRTDPDGNLEWHETYGGSSSEVAHSIAGTHDGGYIITGHTLSYGAGLHDVWLLRLAHDQTSVVSAQTTVSGFGLTGISPNPMTESTWLFFETSTDGPVSMMVYGIDGRVARTLMDQPTAAGFHSVLWDGLNDSGAPVPAGVYLCRLEAGGSSSVGRILVNSF